MPLLSRRKRLVLVATFVTASALGTVAADEKVSKKVKDGRAKFEELWASEDSWIRRSAIAAIVSDEDPRAAQIYLEQVLVPDDAIKADWHVRAPAWRRLAEVMGGKLKADAQALVEKHLKAGPKKTTPALRACLARAIAISAHPKKFELVLSLLSDTSDMVRRSAAWGLAAQADDPRAGEELIALYEKEPETTTRLAIEVRRYLTAIYGEDKGEEKKAWRRFLDEKKKEEKAKRGEGPKPGTTVSREPEEPKENEENGHTVSKGLKNGIDWKARGAGPVPLLVLADATYDSRLYEPWFKPLESICKIYFVKLPKTEDFEESELKRFAKTKYFWYPVDRLVEALEKIRVERKVEKFALCSLRDESLVAEVYATKHPERISKMVLVGSVSGSSQYGDLIAKAQAMAKNRHDDELYHLMGFWQIWEDGHLDYEPKKEGEVDALFLREFTTQLADPLDPANEDLHKLAFIPHTEYVFPDFQLQRQLPIEVPVLVQVGARSIWSALYDTEIIKSFYKAKLTVYEESTQLPMIDETRKWVAEMRAFLAEAPASPKK